jgi:hypothetical protein
MQPLTIKPRQDKDTKMKKFFKRFFGLLIILFVVFIGVGILSQPSDEEAIAAGFENVEEFQEYKSVGFATMAEFEQSGFKTLEQAGKYKDAGFNSVDEFEKSDFSSLNEANDFKNAGYASKAAFKASGFSDFDEAKRYKSAGFETMEQFVVSGFTDFAEAKEYTKAGFLTMQQFNESGFYDISQATALKKYGATLQQAIEAASEVSLEEFKACDTSGGSVYKNECFGKAVLWYAKVDRYSDDGTYLDVVENCEEPDSNSKAAWSKQLSYDFWKQNDGACIQFTAEIRDENWATPTILVKDVVWVETEQARVERIALQERKQKEKAAAEARAKAAELEANKFNPEWLSDEHGIEAGFACKPFVENLAKYTYRWTDGWLDTKFPSYLTSNEGEPYVLTILGDKIEFQNGFGAWSKTKYYCKYNVKTKKVLDAWALG